MYKLLELLFVNNKVGRRFMKRQIAKFVMIIMQFIFYFVVNELFNVPDRIMYNTFLFIWL